MSYADTQDSKKHVTGLAVVIGLHIVVIYGLANGLGQKVVSVLKQPLSVNLIEEVKLAPPPPPPPPKVVPRPKTVTPPPPAYVPPVEVPVQAPPVAAPVITTTQEVPPPAPVAPPAPPAPAVVAANVACPNFNAVRSAVPYPPQAESMGLSGDVVVEFTVGVDGQIRDVKAAKSSHALFTAAATRAVSKFQCISQGRDVRVRVPFSFRL